LGVHITRTEKENMSASSEWIRALSGGALIGIGASLLLAFNGRVAGISGILGGLLRPTWEDVGWRAMFVVGLLLGGMAALWLLDEARVAPSVSFGTTLVAGLLVGVGTRLGHGCTSGHGVCGVARRSIRSLAATLMFIATGAAVVAVTGGSP
jgi:uncharacterized protein